MIFQNRVNIFNNKRNNGGGDLNRVPSAVINTIVTYSKNDFDDDIEYIKYF